jgi:surface protein
MILSTHGIIGSGGAPSVPTFEFTINTANTSAGSSSSDQFKLPLTTSTGLDCVVDWGDGNTDDITSHTAPEVTHTYASSGAYTVKITGDLLGWKFDNGGDRLKMLNIAQWGALNISTDRTFRGCTNLTATATDAPIITTTTLSLCFLTATSFNSDIGNWNVSGVQNFSGMFQSIGNFNNGGSDSIKDWNTANATSMANMFNGCTNFNQPIGSWDVSAVVNFSDMFTRANAFNQDISNWDINQVNNFTNFMRLATGLSTTNYDLLLVEWETNLQSAYPSGVGYPFTISIDFGGSQYTLLSAAATARASLIATYGWTITDGGGI